MSTKLSFAALVLAMCVGGACSAGEEDLNDDWASCAGKCDDGSQGAAGPVTQPDVLVNRLEVLTELERSGFDFGRMVGGNSSSNAMLVGSSPGYASLADVVGADIQALKAADREAGVGLGYSHRLFDASWLRSAKARFQLVAITNRIDLAHTTPGLCGEVRFVYRLGYTTAQGSSRLPMSLMVVVEQPTIGGGCGDVAKFWRDQTGTAAALMPYLSSLGAPARIELNLQAVRWPALARADMGGHAEYLLRVFQIAGASITPITLPNTIRTDLTATEKASLATWIGANLADIDRGVAIVPDAYLATRAYSVSPRGLARGANRPFLAAFPNPEQHFAGLDYGGRALVKSPGGLLRRLDTMTCQGCHQSRGLAGFHVLGQEEATTFRANAIEVGTSPHVNDELAWRHHVVTALASNSEPSQPRPFAERVAGVPGIYGAHCGLAGDPSFATWTCASGFACKDLSGEEIGMCVPAAEAGAGDTCETSNVSFDINSHKDKVSGFEVQRCGTMPTGRAGFCNHSGTKPFTTSAFGGFPNGSCSGGCKTMGAFNDDAICGAHPPSGFNECLASGKPFTECLAAATPAFRRRCDAARPCGDDYVCAGVPGAPRGTGACMPPYFIFQVRVDGHQVK